MATEQKTAHYAIHHRTISVLAKALYEMKNSKAEGVASLRELAGLIRKHSTAVSDPVEAHEHAPALKIPIEAGTYPFVMFLLGGSGSGKSTLCPRLETEFGFTKLSVVELLHAEVENKTELGLEAEDIMLSGGIITETLAQKVVKSAIQREAVPGKRIILYGYPRTVDQAIHFENNICPVSVVVCLTCEEAVLVKRVVDRSKSSDNAEAVQQRVKQFNATASKIKEHYASTGKFHSVDTGNQDVDAFGVIHHILEEAGVSE